MPQATDEFPDNELDMKALEDAGILGPYGNTASSNTILIINPNSNESMTLGLVSMVEHLSKTMPFATRIYFYTGPSPCIHSIDNEEQAGQTNNVISKKWFSNVDSFFKVPVFGAYLVACYSAHPLVSTLRHRYPSRHVTGILEASVWIALSMGSSLDLGVQDPKFGIVTTGTYWEEALSTAVRDLIVNRRTTIFNSALGRFKGVTSTGLNGSELHAADASLVRERMIGATRELVKDGDVKTVILGCAGMSGLKTLVEEALVEELGEEKAKEVYVLDGVSAGIGLLENMLRTCPRKN